MNEKRIRFCEEYVKDYNGAKAAVRAGYKEKNARITASQLLTIPNVKEYIEELQTDLLKQCKVESHVVLNRLMQEATNLENPGSTRVQALVALGKHIGLFTDKVEHSGDVAPTVVKRVAVYRTEDGDLVEADQITGKEKFFKTH